jgi:hypothetical protein
MAKKLASNNDKNNESQQQAQGYDLDQTKSIDYTNDEDREWLRVHLLKKIHHKRCSLPALTTSRGKGMNIYALANFNEKSLKEELPNNAPECMGNGWTDEAMSFDAATLGVNYCLPQINDAINDSVRKCLDNNVNTLQEYIILLEHLALQIEQIAVEAGFEVINNEYLMRKVHWVKPRSKTAQRSTILTMIRQRGFEFSRGVKNHLTNARLLLNNEPFSQYAGVLSDELPLLLNKLWWLSNFNVPVSVTTW